MFHLAVVLMAALHANSSTIGLAAQQRADFPPTIEVTAPKDLADVRAFNETLDALSEKATACVKAGGKPETCQCSYPMDLTSLRKSYASLIKQHPDWKDRMLSYSYVDQERHSISGTMVLRAVRRQLETLKCE